MKKQFIVIALLAIFLNGCGEDLKKKAFNEFTDDNKNTLCQSKEIHNQLQAKFIEIMFGDSIPDDKKTELESMLSFEWKNFKADLSNKKPKQISCNTELTLTADFNYGKSIYYHEMPFFITKNDNNIFTVILERSSKSLQYNYKEIEITPTKGQIKFKNESEQKKLEEKQKKEALEAQKLKEQQARIDSLKEISDSEFTVVTFTDLQYIYFAQANIEFSDDDILSAFYPNWKNITDAFEKRDIIDKKLPEIKTKIAEYKDVKNIIALGIYQGRYDKINEVNLGYPNTLDSFPRTSYDFDTKSFNYKGLMCDNSGIYYNIGTIRLSINESIRQCQIPMEEDNARVVSKKLSTIANDYRQNIAVDTKYYLHIDNVKQYEIETTLVREYLIIKDAKTKLPIIEQMIK